MGVSSRSPSGRVDSTRVITVAVMPGTGVMWSEPSRRGSAYSPDAAASAIRACSPSLPIVRRSAMSTLTSLNVVVSVWAGVNGQFDEVPVEDVLRFESELLEYLRNHTDVLTTIAETGKLEAETEKGLKDAIAEFKKIFVVE